uniref:Uncharacterized protein n=1 Tax=Kalanchoe fedtschenkoi TaxID=63787 RepID=A0A7N0UFI4_KALFE
MAENNNAGTANKKATDDDLPTFNIENLQSNMKTIYCRDHGVHLFDWIHLLCSCDGNYLTSADCEGRFQCLFVY